MTPGYEKSLKIASWFFTFLVSLSLINVLGRDATQTPTPFYVNRGLFFVIGSLLFLRYLTGSAVHLWFEYLRLERNLDKNAFQRDFYFLLIFGSLGLFAFYQNTIDNFLFGTIALVGSALLWGGWNWQKNRTSPWNYWIFINGIQIIVLFFAYLLNKNNPMHFSSLSNLGFLPDALSWFAGLSVWLTTVVLIFVVCLVVDIWMQIRIIENIPKDDSTGDDRDGATGVNDRVRQIRAHVTAIENQLASIAREAGKIRKDVTAIESQVNDIRERVAVIHDNGP